MSNSINGGPSGSPITQPQNAAVEENTETSKQVVVNNKAYTASKAESWGQRMVRKISNLPNIFKPLYEFIQQKFQSLRDPALHKEAPPIGERKASLLTDVAPKMNGLPSSQSSQPKKDHTQVNDLVDKIIYGDFGAEPKDLEPLNSELKEFNKGQICDLKYELIRQGVSSSSQVLQVINEKAAPDVSDRTFDSLEEQAAFELFNEIDTWSKSGLEESSFFRPNAPVDREGSLSEAQETAQHLKGRVRYTTQTVSHLPINTAVRLPSVDGSPEVRLHASMFSMAAGEPDMMMMQGPNKATTGDSWHALFDKNAKVVVDLTPEYEKPRKVAKYYPEEIGAKVNYQSGGIELSVQLEEQESVGSKLQKYTYTVTNESTGESKTIIRLNIQNWIDHSGLSNSDIDGLITATDDIAGKDGLVAVHCSAGVGRTGTFASARTARHILAGNTLTNDQTKAEIFKLAQTGRQNRNPHFIQTADQVETLISYVQSIANKPEEQSVKPASESTAAPESNTPVYATVSKAKKAQSDPIYANDNRQSSAVDTASIDEDTVDGPPPLPPRLDEEDSRSIYANHEAIQAQQQAHDASLKIAEEPTEQELQLLEALVQEANSKRIPTANVILSKAGKGVYGGVKDESGQVSPVDYDSLQLDLVRVCRGRNGQAELEKVLDIIKDAKSWGGEWEEAANNIEDFANRLVIPRMQSPAGLFNRPTGQAGSN